MNGFFRKIPALKEQDRKQKVILRNHMGILSLGTYSAGDSVTDTRREDFLLYSLRVGSMFVFLKQFPGSPLGTGCNPSLILRREGSHSTVKGLEAPKLCMQERCSGGHRKAVVLSV